MSDNNGSTTSLALVKPGKEPEEDDEPDFIKNNKGKISMFRKFGFFLIYWKNGKYEASNRILLLFYLLTYFGAGVIGGLAYGIKEIFKNETYQDQIDDLIEASFVGIFLGIAPSCWIYLLREYSSHLPFILTSTKKVERNKMFKKLEYSKKPEVSYTEGFYDEDHNDDLDEVYKETQNTLKEQWWLVKHGPLVGMILSVSICFILVIVNSFWKVSNIIIKAPTESIEHLKKDAPSFIVAMLYPIPCYVSLWYCIFFLEWQRKIYQSLRYYIRTMKQDNKTKHKKESNSGEKRTICIKLDEEYKEELEEICYMLNKLQRVFILLNKKIFQKTLVLSFTLFIFMGVYICWKILQSHTNFFYILPLGIIFGHVYLVCKWSNDLMAEFNEIIEVLNEMHEDDVQDLRRELHECPPQVCAFGGFSANYSMMTAMIAFMLSIISITGMIWPEIQDQGPAPENQQCYHFQDSTGESNNTLCVKQHCYNYYDQSGRWNQILCIKDKIDDKFFLNGTLSLKNVK